MQNSPSKNFCLLVRQLMYTFFQVKKSSDRYQTPEIGKLRYTCPRNFKKSDNFRYIPCIIKFTRTYYYNFR